MGGMSDEPLLAGDEVLLRYRYPDGSIQAALPMRVVAHEDDLLVCWLAPGTSIRYWATEDGRDPRDLPIEHRFEARLSNGPRTWQGTGALHVLRLGDPFQVLLFRDAGGRFAHWYVNLERPAVRSGARLDSVDRQLDLVIDASGEARWKDLDEAAFAVGTSFLPLEDLIAARETGVRILQDVAGFLAPYRRWIDFAPDPSWPVPGLPDDWSAG
jgi:hypothetical protein